MFVCFINHFVSKYYLKVLFLPYVSVKTLNVADESADVLTSVAGSQNCQQPLCSQMILNCVL